MEANEKLTDLLNDLIQINNDRITGYEKAIQELSPEEAHLRQLFGKYVRESSEFVRELSHEVTNTGGKATSSTTVSGKIYRVWMELRAAASNRERKTVLESCEFGEDAAQRVYQKALESDFDIPVHLRALIARQKSMLQKAHDEVKMHRDWYVAVR